MGKFVRVTFRMDVEDPDHETGLENETFEEVHEAIDNLGGTDVNIIILEEQD